MLVNGGTEKKKDIQNLPSGKRGTHLVRPYSFCGGAVTWDVTLVKVAQIFNFKSSNLTNVFCHVFYFFNSVLTKDCIILCAATALHRRFRHVDTI